LTHSRIACCSFLGALLLLCVGCATSSFTPFETAVSATANPLVAQYSVRHYRPGYSAWVEFGTDTSYGRQTSVVSDSGAPGGSVNVLVAGMRPQTTYHMRAHIESPGGSLVDGDHTFTTGPLPGPQTSQPASSASTLQFPAIGVTLPTPGLTPSAGVELLDLTTATDASHAVQAVATDLQGNIIWYCPGFAFPIKLMENGHFVVVANSELQEIDLSCKIVRNVSVAQVNESLQANGYAFTIPPPLGLLGSNQFHHDILVLPNGHWIALCQIAKTFTDLTGYEGTPTQVVGDALLDIDPAGDVVWAWSAFDHLDANRHPYFGLPDWTHSNALIYTADGNLLLSMRHQAWILKIDYENGVGKGDILWKLGPMTTNEGAGDFTLLNGDVSQWFYAQHFPDVLSSNGSKFRMAIYDNGDFRIGSDGVSCGPPPAPPCYSRAAIFDVDEATHLANLTWQYVPGFYSFWGGNVGVLTNGDFEFDSSAYSSTGAGSQITEVTQTDNPQVVWEMNINGASAYRGYRIPSLYPGVAWQK
jgi:arylsulfate sulfotransferase